MMDSRARLDHAVFHLTPTRTRCDLVAFCGKSSEKLASGLLEPFVAHLQVAKDEILKGGYSITLRPPPNLDSYWFTKATFQRFVRFASTPDTLERFVILEKEIQQIESSIHTDETAAADLDKAKAEGDVAAEVAKEENSKARLQRVLGSRLAILRREQAMAYQRALVLRFDLASIDDLLAFAGCFGASRLRDACINFKDLCMAKHNDSIWMNELAAVNAYAPPENASVNTTAIMLTSEIEPNTADQVPSENGGGGSMPWPGQYPPYMYNFHNPMQQGQHPYMMQPYPPYYPPNMQWSPNMDQSGHHRSHKSGSKKKGRSSDETTSEEDSQSEASDSASDNDVDENKQNGRNYSSGERGSKKKHKKKSSKTVVIRNINYITSKHGEEGVYDSSGNESQGAEKIGKKNGKLGKDGSLDYKNGIETNASGGNGSTETWGNFQNLLMRSKDLESEMVMKQDYSQYVENKAMDMGGEKPRVQQRSIPADSFVSSIGYVANGSRMSLEELENSKGFRPVMRRGVNGGEDALFSRGFVEHNGIQSDFVSESSVNKIVKGEDWSIANQSGVTKYQNGSIGLKSFDGSYELTQAGNKDNAESRRESFVDESIIVQSHSVNVSQNDSHWKTDINMILDQNSASKTENGANDASQDKLGKRLSYEPDDMFFMPERDSAIESGAASFTPKMDYGAEIAFSRDHKKNSGVDDSADVKEATENEVKRPIKEAKAKPVPRYLSRNKPPEIKNKKPFSSKPAVQKSKQEREEEMRRKMEELVIERQRRIAERSAAARAAPKNLSQKLVTKAR